MRKSKRPKSSMAKDITLAIDCHVVKEIRNEARIEGTSVNSKVNDILSKYAVFYKHAFLQESAFIPREIYASMLEIADEDKVSELLQRAVREVMPSVYSHDNVPFTMDGLKQINNSILVLSGLCSSIRYSTDDEYLNMIVEHKYGIKWSRILAVAVTNMTKLFTSHEPEVKVMPYTIVARVLKKGKV